MDAATAPVKGELRSFDWQDAFDLDGLLSEEERLGCATPRMGMRRKSCCPG